MKVKTRLSPFYLHLFPRMKQGEDELFEGEDIGDKPDEVGGDVENSGDGDGKIPVEERHESTLCLVFIIQYSVFRDKYQETRWGNN